MDDEPNAVDGSEYRPTDYLATCGMSFGIGSGQDDAVLNALRFEYPFDDPDQETVTVRVWELYADSWQSHSPRGPERSAEQLSYEEWEIPREYADKAGQHAFEANAALSHGYGNGELIHEER